MMRAQFPKPPGPGAALWALKALMVARREIEIVAA